MPRLLKQTIVAAVFFAAIGLIFYFSLFKDAPEPVLTPGVSVQPPVVESQKLLKISDFDYDFLVEIRNPNFDFGAAMISYELKLFGQNGEPVMVRSGLISLLPGQTRYEIISPLIVDKEISAVEFKFIDASWERLKEFVPQNLFSVSNREFNSLSSGRGATLNATLSNDSNFDFDRVDIHVILFDENNEVLAVNKTDIRTFLAKKSRFFEVKWLVLKSPVGRIEINAYTDVFKNENFIKEHGTPEKFQRFY